MFTNSFRAMMMLLAVIVVTLPACQRAKMKPIPRQERPDPGPGAAEAPPEVDDNRGDDTVTDPQPPVILPPVDPDGEDRTPPEVETEDTPDPDLGGGIVVIRPPEQLPLEPEDRRPPVTEQPDLPRGERNPIPWLDPNAPAHPSVLNRCAWENCEEPPPPPEPIEREGRSYTQTSEPITNQLDVIFVVDTSNSLDEERAAIANNMSRFISKVEKISERNGYNGQLDYQMAVLLAHGPNTALTGKSGASAHGNLFVHQGESLITNPILKSSDVDEELIKGTLLKRFNGNGNLTSVRDRSNTQGEAGLLSLGAFLRGQISNPTGFPRQGAALMIVFVSDENDVCYDYKAANDQFAAIGIDRRDVPQVHSTNKEELDGILRDKPEHEAFLRECGAGDRGQASAVVNLIKTIKGYSEETHNNLPIIPTAVVYRTKGEQQQAQSRRGDFYGDNEMGHGYLNVVNEFGSGMATSLLTDDFGQQLANIGEAALFDLNFHSSLPLQTPDGDWLDLRIIPNSSIRVEVEVKAGSLAGQTITLMQDTEYTIQRTQLAPGEAVRGRILLQRESRQGLKWDNAVIRIYYME